MNENMTIHRGRKRFHGKPCALDAWQRHSRRTLANFIYELVQIEQDVLFRLNKHYRSKEDYEKWKNDLKFMARALAPKPMSTEITFEQWNEFPRILKKSVDDRILQWIERDPNTFTFFDDGTVKDYTNTPVIEPTDYEP